MFLSDYLQYTAGDECPENYHVWSSISVLSSLVGRKVWTKWGRFDIYPNLYIVLLGEPGNGKTTAMSIAKNMVKKIGGVPFSAQCQTHQSIAKEMDEEHGQVTRIQGREKPMEWTPYSIFVTELSHFIGMNSGPMIDFLTTIYDQDEYDYKIKGAGGSNAIKGPYVNLLACTVPEWITSYLKEDIITGGFSRRVLYINEGANGKRIPHPALTEAQNEAAARCVVRGKDIHKLSGEVLWSPEAREWFADWYVNLHIPQDPDVKTFHATKHIQILKLAVLMVIANHPEDFTLRVSDLDLAINLVKNTESALPRVFQGFGRNELKSVSKKGVDVVAFSKDTIISVKQWRSLMFSHANGPELEQILQHLLEASELVKVSKVSKETGKSDGKEYLTLSESSREAFADRTLVTEAPQELTQDSAQPTCQASDSVETF